MNGAMGKSPWITRHTGLSVNCISVHTYCVTSGQQPNLSEPQVPRKVCGEGFRRQCWHSGWQKVDAQ